MINKKMTGKGLSKQTWNICPKIREMDVFLQKNLKAREIFIESGPELCYGYLDDNKPMNHYKKTPEGIEERLSILENNNDNCLTPIVIGSSKYKRTEMTLDDIMDAWIMAIRASKGRTNLQFIPENVQYDSTGLPMRIAF